MHRQSHSRRHRTDLLARPPCSPRAAEGGWAALLVDPIEQLNALADLLARGLLSPDEFERQKAKIFES
jgi:hypothetical protein